MLLYENLEQSLVTIVSIYTDKKFCRIRGSRVFQSSIALRMRFLTKWDQNPKAGKMFRSC
jgi:hypothetical protein